MASRLGIKEKLKNICNVGTAVKLLFTAFLLVSISRGNAVELKDFSSSELFLTMLFVVITAVLLGAVETFFSKYKANEWIMLLSATVFSVSILSKAPDNSKYFLLAAVLIVICIIVNYAAGKGVFLLIPESFGKWGRLIAVAVPALIACFVVASIGVYRYLSYASPNFDFGIWCNMFHNMRESGAPVTTCERDRLLSHFAVHFSPIYYLILPFYFIFPSPVTLQIIQAVVLYSGVIPLVMLAKDKGISDRAAVTLAAIYSFYPAIAAGTFYDLHENCFLVPLLLWCFLFFERKKDLPLGVCALLVLCVKEDAFVYLIILAVYAFFLKEKKKTALCLALGAVIWFAVVSSLMKAFGTGIMVGRYDNLIADSEDGLWGVVKTALMAPGYLLTQIFATKNGDNAKILYVFQLLVPLAVLPLTTRKISRYILVLPLLMNLMTMYVYQPNLRFQYSFGITAFLFYAALLNLSELGEKAKSISLPMALIAALLIFSFAVCSNYGYYFQRYQNGKAEYERMDNVLAEVLPKDSSVACSTFLLPHIADREEIYEVNYHKENGSYKTDIEYVALDMRYAEESGEALEYYLENGYEEYHNDGGRVLILKKK